MYDHAPKRRVLGGRAIPSAVLALLAFGSAGRAAELDLNELFHGSIPASPFIGVVYGYADAMLEHGRDTYGPQKTGLLLSALDRQTLAPLKTRPPAPAGVSAESRPGPRGKPLVGANPQMDQNLLRLLYFLKGLSGKESYPQAADAELKWLLNGAQSPTTGLLPWGRHMSWNVMTDEVAAGGEGSIHEFSRPWMLWERCFELAPQQSKRFALGLWEHHVADRKTGAIRSRADFDRRGSRPATDSPRHAGFFIRTWAEAFAHTQDKTFLEAIDVVLTRYQRKRRCPSACDWLSMAIDCDGAARKVPQPLRTRLTAFAAGEDARFCRLPHDLGRKKGFVKSLEPAGAAPEVSSRQSEDLLPSPRLRGEGPQSENLLPSPRLRGEGPQSENLLPSPRLRGEGPGVRGLGISSYTSLWDPTRGRQTTAAVGVMCTSRYQNTGRVGFRELIVAAADAYLDSLPGEQIDAWPLSFGQAITLELAAFRITAREEYHARAFKLGEIAVEKFFGDGPLPRASLKSDHYESTTGADTLALSLAELHLSTLTITVVRTPANTIDR